MERYRLRARVVLLLLGVAAGSLLPGSASAQYFGRNKVQYQTFDFQVLHSPHFDVYFYEEERASLQRVVDAAESAYLDLSKKFNFQVSKKIPLIFYATHSAFEQSNGVVFNKTGDGVFVPPLDLKTLGLFAQFSLNPFEDAPGGPASVIRST